MRRRRAKERWFGRSWQDDKRRAGSGLPDSLYNRRLAGAGAMRAEPRMDMPTDGAGEDAASHQACCKATI